jgi:hypothetical protein
MTADDKKPPSPYDLWVQAGGGTDSYDPERYRELLYEGGCILRSGDEGYEQSSSRLPCGWPGGRS